MKKLFVFTVSVALVLGLMAGCSAAAPPAGTSQPPAAATQAPETSAPAQKTVITVTRWGDATVANDPEKIMIDKFNAENTLNIEVRYDVIPGDGYGDRLTTSFSSGEGYDIFASGEGDFYKWVKAGLTRPMNDLMAADTGWDNQMSQALLEMGNIEGNQYYFVRDYNTIALYYAKDVFDKNNVPYPTKDWTWEDLKAAAKKLTVKKDDGTYASFGYNAQSWEYAVLSYLVSNGVDIMDDAGTTVDGYQNSPEVARLLEEYIAMAEGDDRISPTPADLDTFGDASAMLANGTLAMTLNGGWGRGSLDSNNVNYGTVIVPGNHKSYLCAAAFAMSSRVKNPEAAWEVMKLLVGTEISQLKVEHSAVFPTVDSELQKLIDATDETTVGLLEQIQYSIQPVGARAALGNPAASAFKEALERMVFHDGDTQTILNDAVQTAMENAD
jgi:multiple sugar transport system substrate-binding protein